MVPAGHQAITNDVALPTATRGIYVGVSGNINAKIAGVTVLYKGAVAGSIIPGRFEMVVGTSTTATDLVALLDGPP